jgi:hypothetical protein
VERVVEDGASVGGVVFTTGACKVAGTVKTTQKVDFEINPIDTKKKKKKKKKWGEDARPLRSRGRSGGFLGRRGTTLSDDLSEADLK